MIRLTNNDLAALLAISFIAGVQAGSQEASIVQGADVAALSNSTQQVIQAAALVAARGIVPAPTPAPTPSPSTSPTASTANPGNITIKTEQNNDQGETPWHERPGAVPAVATVGALAGVVVLFVAGWLIGRQMGYFHRAPQQNGHPQDAVHAVRGL